MKKPQLYIVNRTDAVRLNPLTDDQIQRLRLDDLPPVKYDDLGHMQGGIAGYCPHSPTRPGDGGGEVVIDISLAEGKHLSERHRAHRLKLIYLHEVAHRLTQDQTHSATFAAVCAALTMRACDTEGEAMAGLGWYEVQDGDTPGAAFDHAIDFARKHARSATPAHELPALAAIEWEQKKRERARMKRVENDVEVSERMLEGCYRAGVLAHRKAGKALAQAKRRAFKDVAFTAVTSFVIGLVVSVFLFR